MALGSTQPLTETSTRNLPGGKGWPARTGDSLTAVCEPIVWKMWGPQRLGSVGLQGLLEGYTFWDMGCLEYLFVFFFPRSASYVCLI
jgi:hypothetical protein